MHSRPSSKLPTINSNFPNCSCTVWCKCSTSSTLCGLHRDLNETWMLSSSLTSASCLLITLDITEHLAGVGSDRNETRSWNTRMLDSWTSRSTRMTSERWSSSWLEIGSDAAIISLPICFNETISLLASFFTFFLSSAKWAVPTSGLGPVLRLLIVDWRSWTCSLICHTISLETAHTSKILTDPSKSPSTDFSCWHLLRTCWVDLVRRTSSKQM